MARLKQAGPANRIFLMISDWNDNEKHSLGNKAGKKL